MGRKAKKVPQTRPNAFGGLAFQATRNPHFVFKHHPAAKPHPKPSKVFSVWVKYYQPPWLCFVEIIIFALFFLLAITVQNTTLIFFQYFGKAVNIFFLEGYDVYTDDQVDSLGDKRIFTKPDFRFVFNSSLYKFFAFDTDFACSYKIDRTTDLTLYILTLDGEELSFHFEDDNKTLANEIVEPYLSNFSLVRLSVYYAIETTKYGQIIESGVISNFYNFEETGIILWNLDRDRVVRNSDNASSLFPSISLFLPFSLSCGCYLTPITFYLVLV
ncbi:uncharacterized protein GO595_008693 [Histomonas meleagridis]|uniref:uncharacterized protein n=1 Tax=Histomonas meleagridis TaxID=135588 RepID=UPI0035593F79|nr:hypothetical protein GO595_008693 [Histomonas meleagridis]